MLRKSTALILAFITIAVAQAVSPQPAQTVGSYTAPDRPHAVPDRRPKPITGVLVMVAPTANLQAVIDQAHADDGLMLPAGQAYTGNFTVNKPLTLQSTAAADLMEGVRVGQAHAAKLARIQTPNNAPALDMLSGAKNLQLIGIEATFTGSQVDTIIRLGQGDDADAALIPTGVHIGRCWVHGVTRRASKRGIGMNSGDTAIVDTTVDQVGAFGYDTQAICGWGGPGPFLIDNCRLQAAGENFMLGGAPTRLPIVPADLTFTRNLVDKPIEWNPASPNYAGWRVSVKNNFELKACDRALIEGNTFENCWLDGQIGCPILIKTADSSDSKTANPWTVTQNIIFRANIVRNAPHGLTVLASETPASPGRTNRVLIEECQFVTDGREAQLLGGVSSLAVRRCTFWSRATSHTMILSDLGQKFPGLRYESNLAYRGQNGIKGDSSGEGTQALNDYSPDWVFQGNVVIGAPASRYPPGNQYPADDSMLGLDADHFPPAGASFGAERAVIAAAMVPWQVPPPPDATPEFLIRDGEFITLTGPDGTQIRVRIRVRQP